MHAVPLRFHKSTKSHRPVSSPPPSIIMDPLAIRQAIHDAASKMRGAFLREDPQVQLLCASSHSPHITTYMDMDMYTDTHTR